MERLLPGNLGGDANRLEMAVSGHSSQLLSPSYAYDVHRMCAVVGPAARGSQSCDRCTRHG